MLAPESVMSNIQHQRNLDQMPNIQLQRINLPTKGDNSGQRGPSPVRHEVKPIVQHGFQQRERVSPVQYQVSTIRRTPSPAHAPIVGRQVAQTYTQGEGDRSQPINLSVHEPVKRQGIATTIQAGGVAGGSIMSSAQYQQLGNRLLGIPGHTVTGSNVPSLVRSSIASTKEAQHVSKFVICYILSNNS